MAFGFKLGLGLSQRGASDPFNFFATASFDLNFADQSYRQSVGGAAFNDLSTVSGWSYSRTGTRTVLNVAGDSIDFGPNLPPITDRGIYVGDAAGASGADVMPLITRAELGSDATIYAEFYDVASPATSDIIWSLNSNNPGHSTAGFIAPNGGASIQSATYGEIVKTAMSYTDGVDRSAVYDGTVWEHNTALNGTVTGKTAIGVARYATSTGVGQPNAYIRRLAIFPQRYSTEALRVLTTQPGLVLAGVGDSIMKGDGVDEFLPIVAANLGADVFAPNYGVNGSSWVYDWASDPHVGTLTDDLDRISGLLEVPTPRGHKMIAFAGTNGIVLKGNTAAQEYADFETFISAALADGWVADNIVVCTMLPRTGVSETTRGDYNDLLVSGASTYGYRLARFDLNATMGAAGADTNLTYYSDGTHPTTAGHVILADIVTGAIA